MTAKNVAVTRFDASRREFLGQGACLAFGVVLANPLSSFRKSLLCQDCAFVQRATFTMGTVVRVSMYGENKKHCNHVIDRVFAEFHRIDRLMSVFKVDSEISQINQQAGISDVHVAPCVVEILQRANKLSRLTGGAFDVTVEPLMELWGFRSETLPRTQPSDRKIADTLASVGYHNVIVNENAGIVGLNHRRSRIDLGGIAVGYSLDRTAQILKAEGIDSALINHSGDILALGSPPESREAPYNGVKAGRAGPHEHEAWEIGIADPRHPETPVTKVQLRDGMLSTSGNYRNFLEIRGQRYGHIMNPRSGLPANAVLSVTAIARRGVDADGLSTASFVLGPKQSEPVLHHFDDAELISIVVEDGRLELYHQRAPSRGFPDAR